MEMREKVLTFLTHKSKPGVVQTMLVLVKVLSGQYDSYPLTQLALVSKCLCKYYISMIVNTESVVLTTVHTYCFSKVSPLIMIIFTNCSIFGLFYDCILLEISIFFENGPMNF